MTYLGDFTDGQVVRYLWNTFNGDGASVTRATDGTISVYKDGGATQSTAGITNTEDFDSLTGVHLIAIDTAADAFYAAGSDYIVVLSAATIDGDVVNAALFTFSIENRQTRLRGTLNDFDEFTTAFETTHGTGNYESDTTDLAAAIWGVLAADHNTVNSMGAAINTILSASALDPGDVATAVFDLARTGHTAAGSFGEAVEQIMALPEVAEIVSGVLSGVLATYASAGNVANALTNASTFNPASDTVTVGDIGNNVIDDAALATDLDVYQARVWLFKDEANVTDRYAVVWYKGGHPVVSGITTPLIQVFAVANGADLIAETAMTQIASTGTYRYNATTTARTTAGAGYIAKVTATIDGSARVHYQPIGRDSAAA